MILYLNSIKPGLSEDQMFISLREAAEYCEYYQEYLSLLVQKGRLTVVKIGTDWMTTKENVEENINRYKR